MKTRRPRLKEPQSILEGNLGRTQIDMSNQNPSSILTVCLPWLTLVPPPSSSHLAYTGEEIVEPEVNLSPFLEKQRLSDLSTPSLYEHGKIEDGDEVDHSLAHISSRPGVSAPASRKGQVQSIEWDDGLDQLSREKAATEAERGVLMIYVRVRDTQLKLTNFFLSIELKSRFRAKQESTLSRREQKQQGS